MDHIIERIAHHADIDTRRAMGFPPRRLDLADLDLPFIIEEYTEFHREGRARFIKGLRNAELYLCPDIDEVSWVFGTDDFMTSRSYSFRNDGHVSIYALCKMEHSWHPDFNEDGSFKRAFTTGSYQYGRASYVGPVRYS
jgi:hypothetical protein